MSNPLSDADIRVTQGIFEALKKQKNNDEFHDVVVVVGSSEFKCHRVILASVSGFFRGLFASGMNECLESRVKLGNVSGDIFSQILDCIYSGRSILTKENIFQIWAAVDALDLRFLLEECEHFFKNTLTENNCIFYCFSTRLLNEECNREALNCIAMNFRKIRHLRSILRLTFEEMKYLVSSEKLDTFREDDVIEIILRWVESTPTVDHHSDTLLSEKGASLVSFNDNVASCKTLEDEKSAGETACQDSEEQDEEVDSEEQDEKVDSEEQDEKVDSEEQDEEVDSKEQDEKVDSKEQDEEVDSKEQDEEVPASRSDLLAELLECSRYLLTSYSYLVQRLACHPLVKGHARCLALVDKISRYLADTGLQQEWCPQEAIHRDGESVKKVFLLYDRRGKASVLYPPGADCYQIKGASKNLDIGTLTGVSPIFYVGGNLLTLDSGNNLLLHTPLGGGLNTKTVARVWEHHNTVLIGDLLYSFEENTDDKAMSLFKMRLSDIINPLTHPSQWQRVCYLSVKGLSLKATTSIGNKVIVFFAGAREAGFTVECCDLFQVKYFVMKNQLGSVSDLVTFRRDNEAFALQTNGALWRISLCPSSDELEFTQECQLWADIDVTLYGAFLYGTYLHILGESRVDMSFVTDIALQGVFENIIFHNSKFYSYAHAVLSKRLLQKK
ncbi:kelch repeat and BTB domain-containing protein 12 [Plakobranchus ocellatus]|uniref:Kelch repeat and BTB domain-containing protein 12 n=1 Tax=Plakobranchus ocellatus TaxID=259542 RepID=A0AAV4DA09_9GAST|nr:kelch repeat and BTB domain-containing protein 12 [Plakobranchus ocellatus]